MGMDIRWYTLVAILEAGFAGQQSEMPRPGVASGDDGELARAISATSATYAWQLITKDREQKRMLPSHPPNAA